MAATAEQMWDLMSPKGRAKLMLRLGVPDHSRPGWCKGLALRELARVGSEELPPELLGRLMLAMTLDGPSPDEFHRCCRVITRAVHISQNSKAA